MSDEWILDKRPASPYQAYLEESREPLAGLVFAAPLFVVYHIGIFYFNRPGGAPWANGADVFIDRVLSRLGVGGPLLSLFVIVTTLLFMQQAQIGRWRLPRSGTLLLMLCECLLFALPPFLLGKLVSQVLLSVDGEGASPLQVRLVLSFGAGIYEEFLFRVVFLGVSVAVLRKLGWRGRKVYFAAVLLQALLFALFHHLPGGGEELGWEMIRSGKFLRAFAFRAVGGVYFAYVYQERGFGIAAGSHAAYDVAAVLLQAFR